METKLNAMLRDARKTEENFLVEIDCMEVT